MGLKQVWLLWNVDTHYQTTGEGGAARSRLGTGWQLAVGSNSESQHLCNEFKGSIMHWTWCGQAEGLYL